jgi:hypothetical protein
MNTTTLEREMPYHFIPNTNHDLVIVESAFIVHDGDDVFEARHYPIIGWRIEDNPKGGLTMPPIPHRRWLARA